MDKQYNNLKNRSAIVCFGTSTYCPTTPNHASNYISTIESNTNSDSNASPYTYAGSNTNPNSTTTTRSIQK